MRYGPLTRIEVRIDVVVCVSKVGPSSAVRSKLLNALAGDWSPRVRCQKNMTIYLLLRDAGALVQRDALSGSRDLLPYFNPKKLSPGKLGTNPTLLNRKFNRAKPLASRGSVIEASVSPTHYPRGVLNFQPQLNYRSTFRGCLKESDGGVVDNFYSSVTSTGARFTPYTEYGRYRRRCLHAGRQFAYFECRE